MPAAKKVCTPKNIYTQACTPVSIFAENKEAQTVSDISRCLRPTPFLFVFANHVTFSSRHFHLPVVFQILLVKQMSCSLSCCLLPFGFETKRPRRSPSSGDTSDLLDHTGGMWNGELKKSKKEKRKESGAKLKSVKTVLR